MFDPAEAYLVTSALAGRRRPRHRRARCARSASKATSPARPARASDYRDAWFIGYTPDIVIAVWVGFDDGQSVRVTGAVAALPIFADVLEVARGKAPAAECDVPTGVETVDVDRDSGLRAGFGCCGGSREVFLRGTAPEPTAAASSALRPRKSRRSPTSRTPAPDGAGPTPPLRKRNLFAAPVRLDRAGVRWRRARDAAA